MVLIVVLTRALNREKNGANIMTKTFNLEQDWERVLDVWVRIKDAFPNPEMQLFESNYEMRKLDRGIDYPLRRLLDSEKYGQRIRVYGSISGGFGRSPFRWDNKVWLLIRVKTSLGAKK